MRTDLWGWFNRFAARALVEKHIQKQHLVHLYDLGWAALRAEKHSEALNHFEEGLLLARQLHLPCFELFFDYWCTETLIFYQNDYRAGLERAIKMGARAHREQYLECPVRGRVYYTLMYIYYAMDVIGYEEKIREMLDYMTAEIPLDDDTYQRTLYTRASLAYALEDYTQAEHIIQEYINITLGNAHRQSGGYNMLRMIAYARGELSQALNYAYTAGQYALHSRLENSVALALLWQAVYTQYLGQELRASALHHQGKVHHDRFNLKPLPEYHNAVCEFLELDGQVDAAIIQRQTQLAEITEIGSVSYTANSHLQTVRLLGRAGKDVGPALAKAYEAAEALLKPARFHGKLAEIEAGNYYEFDWQRAYL